VLLDVRRHRGSTVWCFDFRNVSRFNTGIGCGTIAQLANNALTLLRFATTPSADTISRLGRDQGRHRIMPDGKEPADPAPDFPGASDEDDCARLDSASSARPPADEPVSSPFANSPIMQPLPVFEDVAFTCSLGPQDGRFRHTYIPPPGPAVRPTIIKTDKTRSLIRALRSRADCALLPSAAPCASADAGARDAQQRDRDSEEQVGARRVVKLARRDVTLERLMPDRRLSCTLMALSFAKQRSRNPSRALSDLYQASIQNRRAVRDPAPLVMREIAETMFEWTVKELKTYMREAGLAGNGLRIELARRLYAHFLPRSG
jgi:hypothetical protein